MEQKVETRGRKIDASKKEAILECVAMGLGYAKSVPILIEKGFVDENGNCTINIGSFHHYRALNAEAAKIVIDATREEKEWAKSHEKEILTYIRTRMQME